MTTKSKNRWREAVDGAYPSTLFVVLLGLGIASFLVPGWWFGFAVTALLIVFAVTIGESSFIGGLVSALAMLGVFMLVIRTLFSGGDNVLFRLGPLAGTFEGLTAGLTMVSSVFALGGGLLLFFKLVPIRRITAALENAGVSPSFAYVLLSAMQMIPEMKKRSDVIMDAQKTRGVETEGGVRVRAKAFLPVLVPLVLSSLSDTEERVMTLEARAFTVQGQRHRLIEVLKRPVDHIIFWGAVTALLGLIVWRIFA